MFELLKKINDLSIRKKKNKCYVWSIVFVADGEREQEEDFAIQPRNKISVTLLSGFAGYRCAPNETRRQRRERSEKWKVKWMMISYLLIMSLQSPLASIHDPSRWSSVCAASSSLTRALHSNIISSWRPWQKPNRTWTNTILILLPVLCMTSSKIKISRTIELFTSSLLSQLIFCVFQSFNKISSTHDEISTSEKAEKQKKKKRWILNRFWAEDRRVIDRDSIGY